MMKRIAQLKSKKGTTLVEVLVATFITSILMGIAFGMMSTEKRLMASIKSNAYMDSVCDTVNEYVRGSIGTAKGGRVLKYTVSDSGNIKTVAENYISSAAGNNEKLYAMMIRYPNPSQPHNTDNPQMARIYDFGSLESSNLSNFESKLTSVMSENDAYGLFYDDYYSNSSFEMVVTASGKNVKLSSQFRNPYTGELANQPRSINFSLMDGSISSDFGADDDMGDGMVILYTKKDLSVYTP